MTPFLSNILQNQADANAVAQFLLLLATLLFSELIRVYLNVRFVLGNYGFAHQVM